MVGWLAAKVGAVWPSEHSSQELPSAALLSARDLFASFYSICYDQNRPILG